MRYQTFDGAARREERAYPLWICKRQATLARRQMAVTLRAELWRLSGGVAPQSQSATGYAPSSRLASQTPEFGAPVAYLRDGFLLMRRNA